MYLVYLWFYLSRLLFTCGSIVYLVFIYVGLLFVYCLCASTLLSRGSIVLQVVVVKWTAGWIINYIYTFVLCIP